MVAAGRQFALGTPYYLGLFCAALLGLYHQYLIRERNPDACFRAFLHNNWVGAVIFAGVVLNYTP